MNSRRGRPAIHLEVDRLLLHDPAISGARAERMRELIETELTRLLVGASIDVRSATFLSVVAPAAAPHPDDHQLATRLARAILRAVEEGSAHGR
jgi:hypothetical protein